MSKATDAPDCLDVRIFVDPADELGEDTSALERCHAALAAISGRLAPRLDRSIWHREPFELHVAAAEDAAFPEPHLCARMAFGDSVDDEWFAVGLLLQLTKEQRDTTIVARDSDGEFLLIEAAESLPRWLTPETAPNRVFIRRGELHILPRASTPAEQRLLPTQPSLAAALKALRSGLLDTRSPAATAAILQRTAPLHADRTARGPPRHYARCLLPLPAAQLLAAQPQLVSAAAAAFLERTPDAMRAASRMERFSPRTHPVIGMRVAFPRCRYAQLATLDFTPPPQSGLPRRPADHPDHRPADLGSKVAFGLEMLLHEAPSTPLAATTPPLDEAVDAVLRGGGVRGTDSIRLEPGCRGGARIPRARSGTQADSVDPWIPPCDPVWHKSSPKQSV